MNSVHMSRAARGLLILSTVAVFAGCHEWVVAGPPVEVFAQQSNNPAGYENELRVRTYTFPSVEGKVGDFDGTGGQITPSDADTAAVILGLDDLTETSRGGR
jgi:hypothetical protein